MEESLPIMMHRQWKGKIEMISRVPVGTPEELAVAYTPGVAEPCLEIKTDESKSYEYTRRWNTVAVITNGTAVLGLGDIGPVAGMPVMEGKAVLFKAFGNVDAVPLCIDSKDPETVIKTVALLQGSFGGVNLEDIAAPECFEIEQELKKICKIPIFHDDQHGTATVVLAGLKNALKLVDKQLENIKIVINGCGAAGISIAKLLVKAGAKNVLICDRKGVIYPSRKDLSPCKQEIAELTNTAGKKGKLTSALKGADVFIGVSAANILKPEDIATMNEKTIVFAMANPVPEIMPEAADKGGAYIIGTGRSDYPNQVNNVLAFPGIFRGALDVRASDINDEMLLAAADAIAGCISEEELEVYNVIPSPLCPGVADKVAAAVAEAARKTGVARL